MPPTEVSIFERNKQLYLNEESKLREIICDTKFLQNFQAWLDHSISQLDFQFDRCEQQLSELQQHVSVRGGSYWNSQTVIAHCNLHMSEQRLVRHMCEENEEGEGEEGTQLPDLIELISTLQQTKVHSFITPKQRKFIEECEKQLSRVTFEPRDLKFITNALRTKLVDDGNTRGVFGDLTSFQSAIEELTPDIDQCEQLLEASIANGEMALAEDISCRQLEVYDHILRLITAQYPIISSYYTESRSSDRRRRWSIFRMADRDIAAVMEAKMRQVEACEEDLSKIRDQIKNYNSDDVEQKKRYEMDRGESDQFLRENKEKQQGVWNRVFELYQQLQGCSTELATLAQQRQKEVDRRLQTEAQEAGRRSGHEAFLQAAAEHSKKLQSTIDNAVAAREVATALNSFVLDGCDSIAAKYDKQQNALSEMLRLVQQHHFRRFSDYYIAASRYLYRKERRLQQLDEEISANQMQRELLYDTLNPNAKKFTEQNHQLSLKRREVAQDVMHIRHKLDKAEKAVTPTLRSLEFSGVPYVHPSDIVEKMNLSRWSTILDYREVAHPSEAAAMDECQREAAAIESTRAQLAAERVSMQEHKKNQAVQQAALHSVMSVAAGNPTLMQSLLQEGAHGDATKANVQSRFAEKMQALLQRPDSQPVKRTLLSNGTFDGPAAAASSSPPPARMMNVSATTGSGLPPIQTRRPEDAAVEAASAGPKPMTAATTPARMEGAVLRAMFSYTARAPDELSFEAGQDIVCISRAPDEGWFRGVCDQRTGLFPVNYVQLAPEGGEKRSAPAATLPRLGNTI